MPQEGKKKLDPGCTGCRTKSINDLEAAQAGQGQKWKKSDELAMTRMKGNYTPTGNEMMTCLPVLNPTTPLALCDSKTQGPAGVPVWGVDSTPRQNGAGPGWPGVDEPTAAWQRALPQSRASEWPRSSSPGPGQSVGSGKQQWWPGRECRAKAVAGGRMG